VGGGGYGGDGWGGGGAEGNCPIVLVALYTSNTIVVAVIVK